MKLKSSLALLALSAASLSAASDVLDLTAATFDTEISNFDGLSAHLSFNRHVHWFH